MTRTTSRWTALVVLLALLTSLAVPRPLGAMTYSSEEELGQEFVRYVETHMEVVADQYISGYVNAVGQRVLSHFPPQQLKFRFRVIKSDVYNAFAGPGGHIFIHSGLLAAMASEDELAGILGHEIAHVTSRHISKKLERQKKINYATLAGILAGALVGAAGAAAGAQALTYGSMAAGQSAQLAYSRENELEADEKGLNAIAAAGYDGYGLLDILRKIRSREWFGSKQVPTYLKTHPATEDRILYIDGWMANHKKTQHPIPAGNLRGFDMAHTRILALYTDRQLAFKHFQNQVDRQPDRAIAHYGYGLVLIRSGKYAQAIDALDAALRIRPRDPYLQGTLGQACYLGGRYQAALQNLAAAVGTHPEFADGLFFLGRTYQQLGQYPEAALQFEALYDIAPQYPRIGYFLGNVYGKLGRLGEAHYHFALYYLQKGEPGTARFHLDRARKVATDPVNQDRIEELLSKIKRAKPGQKSRRP